VGWKDQGANVAQQLTTEMVDFSLISKPVHYL